MKLLELGSLFETMQRDGGPDVAPFVRSVLALLADAVRKDALARPPTVAYLELMAKYGYNAEAATTMRETVWRYDT